VFYTPYSNFSEKKVSDYRGVVWSKALEENSKDGGVWKKSWNILPTLPFSTNFMPFLA
jgi:hypothetical protein